MLKKQNGITLIALIITIIVMLILVGVTINVALNGGLFEKAETATKQTQIEKGKEELLSAVVAAIGTDGKVVPGNIQLPEGWSETNGIYTSPKGNTYTVDANGKITEIITGLGGEEPTTPVDIKYFRTTETGNGTLLINGFNNDYKLPDGNYGEGEYIITDLIIPSKGIVNGTEQKVWVIMASSFRACSTIKTLVVPETVESIQPMAFYDCTSLIKVEIPSSVTFIGSNVFGGCSSDLKIYVDKYEEECSSWTSNWFGSAKEVIYKTEQ